MLLAAKHHGCDYGVADVTMPDGTVRYVPVERSTGNPLSRWEPVIWDEDHRFYDSRNDVYQEIGDHLAYYLSRPDWMCELTQAAYDVKRTTLEQYRRMVREEQSRA